MLFNQSCSNSAFGVVSGGQEKSHHRSHGKNRFAGTSVMNEMTIFEHLATYYTFLFDKKERVPPEQLPRKKVELSSLLGEDANQLRVAWLGHSSLLINIDGYTILTDPLFQRTISPVGPTRFADELVLEVDDLPFVDTVIISHDHYDHLNKFSVLQLAGKTERFVAPLRVGERLKEWGVADEKIVELNWWEEYSSDRNLTIVATPAQHFSGRGLFDKNATLWASWVILTPKHRVFFSGDSGYFNGFKEVGKKYGPFHMTFLECGAYNQRWSKVHMFPEQTVQAHRDLRGKILQPIHLATFNLSFHPWYDPMERLVSEAWREGIRVSLPVVGKTVDYHNLGRTSLWWQEAMEHAISQRELQQIAKFRYRPLEEE